MHRTPFQRAASVCAFACFILAPALTVAGGLYAGLVTIASGAGFAFLYANRA